MWTLLVILSAVAAQTDYFGAEVPVPDLFDGAAGFGLVPEAKLLNDLDRYMEEEAYGLAKLLERVKLFDPFAGLFKPGLSMLFGSDFELMPNVTISGADCLITVDLQGMDLSGTSIKVYSSETQVDLEIAYMKSEGFEDRSSEEELKEGQSKRLRGFGAVTSMTTIRSFPAPAECEMTAKSSRATLNAEHNTLLIKFPKRAIVEDHSELPEKVVQPPKLPGEEQPESSETQIKKLQDAGGWWTNVFKRTPSSKDKIPVPIVQNDEF